MSNDFSFLYDPYNKQWVILSPRRATRPDELSGFTRPCPFCNSAMVVDNKFPFAPVHKIIIHSPDHKKNFDKLPLGQVEKVFQTYQEQYNLYCREGNVVIFHNYGPEAGASVIHPHSQLVVMPKHISLNVPQIPLIQNTQSSENSEYSVNQKVRKSESLNIRNSGSPSFPSVLNKNTLDFASFFLLCPQVSQWPDEVWIVYKKHDKTFGDLPKEHIRELSHIVARVIQLLDLRHGNEFSFNFYISPWKNWYLRIIPRLKKRGGFELATGVYVNTQDPRETLAFLKEHFHTVVTSVSEKHKAKYHRGV